MNSFTWTPTDDYTYLTVKGRTFGVPPKNFIENHERTEEDKLAIANSYYEFLEAMVSMYGAKQIGMTEGPIAGGRKFYARTVFTISTIRTSGNKIADDLAKFGKLSSARQDRISILTPSATLFIFEATHDRIYNFSGQDSVIRLGLPKTDLQRFDIASNISGFHHELETHAFTMPHIVDAFAKAKKVIKLQLENAGVKVTDTTYINYLPLLTVKNSEFMEESLAAMPYLSPTNDTNTNLALMANMGLTFEKLFAISTMESYPETLNDLKEWIDLPYQWMVKGMC